MEKEKLTHTCENQFNKTSCKINNYENTNADAMKKGRILEAELHKELLDKDFQCCHEHCQECNNIMC